MYPTTTIVSFPCAILKVGDGLCDRVMGNGGNRGVMSLSDNYLISPRPAFNYGSLRDREWCAVIRRFLLCHTMLGCGILSGCLVGSEINAIQ